MSTRVIAAAAVAAVAVVWAAPRARADVTIEQTIAVEGFGPSKLGALDGKTVTAITPDRSRTEQQTQFRSRLLRTFAKGGGSDSVRIVRLDKEVIDELNVGKKTYTELSFQQMRTMAANAAQSAAGARPAAEPQSASAGTPVDESKCQWSAPKTDVKQGEQATIAGSNAQRVTIAVTTTCSDPGSNTSCDFVFSLDEWLAPEMPGAAETRAFWRAYAQKLNLGDELSASMQANAQQVFDRYKSGWGEAMKQAGLQKGYPVKSIMSMQYGGPQCKDNSTSNANASNTADTSSASSPPTSIGDAASSLASGLFNRMRKKPDESQSSTPGMVQLFQMSSETVAVRTDSIPKQAFEVPADYSLVAGAGVP